jgi:hypothetical protein
MNYIKKSFEQGNDIASALINLQPTNTDAWRPSMSISMEEVSASSRNAETRQFEIEFQSDYDHYRRRQMIYDNNVVKAYALLWEKCSKGMTNKIEARSDFRSQIENNPIKLLKAIREHSLNYQENRYGMSIILNSMKTLLNIKQKKLENLQDFTKRFRVTRDVMESHIGGPIILQRVIESMEDYNKEDPTKNKKIEKQAFKQFLGYMYLEALDQTKYGSILVGLNTQQSLRNDQYPKTVTEANNVLSNHRFDAIKANAKTQQSTKNSNDNIKKESTQEIIPLSFAQMEGKC